jgi:hypothetical protein
VPAAEDLPSWPCVRALRRPRRQPHMPPWRRRGAGQRAGRRCCRGLGHAGCYLG